MHGKAVNYLLKCESQSQAQVNGLVCHGCTVEPPNNGDFGI